MPRRDDTFLKLYRRSLDSDVFEDPQRWRVWCWCLMRATWKTRELAGRILNPGEFIMSIAKASAELGVGKSTLLTHLKWLETQDMIVREQTTKFTIVRITNWSVYQQESGPGSGRLTAKSSPESGPIKTPTSPGSRPVCEQSGLEPGPKVVLAQDPNNKAKKYQEETGYINNSLISEIWNAYPEVGRGDQVADSTAIQRALSRIDGETLFIRVGEYARIMSGKDHRFIMRLANWMRDGRWADADDRWHAVSDRGGDDPSKIREGLELYDD